MTISLKNAFEVVLVVEPSTSSKKEYKFDAFTGGKGTRAETKYTAADRVTRSYTGLSSYENVTLDRVYEPERDGAGILAHDLRGKPCEIIVKDIDAEGQSQANRPPYIGKILEVTPPDGDTDDASSIVKLSVTVSVENPVAEQPIVTEPVAGP